MLAIAASRGMFTLSVRIALPSSGLTPSGFAGAEDLDEVKSTTDALSVDLVDGRTVSVPLAWYPRLLHATPAERKNWRLVGKGEGIHWPDLDEDISIENIVFGQPSGESQSSFKRWLEKRRAVRNSMVWERLMRMSVPVLTA